MCHKHGCIRFLRRTTHPQNYGEDDTISDASSDIDDDNDDDEDDDDEDDDDDNKDYGRGGGCEKLSV